MADSFGVAVRKLDLKYKLSNERVSDMAAILTTSVHYGRMIDAYIRADGALSKRKKVTLQIRIHNSDMPEKGSGKTTKKAVVCIF